MAGNQFDPSDLGNGMNEINITPFVDVVLVLLVIFMVTAPVMIKESMKVKLPKALTSDQQSKSLTVGVAITKEGQIVFKGQLIGPENFELELKSIASTNPDTNFLLSADADARHGDVVHAIDLLKKNGLNNFAFQIDKIKGK